MVIGRGAGKGEKGVGVLGLGGEVLMPLEASAAGGVDGGGEGAGDGKGGLATDKVIECLG